MNTQSERRTSKTRQVAGAMQGGGAFTRETVEALYQDVRVANTYDEERFNSRTGRLNHLLEVDAVFHSIKSGYPCTILDVATGTGRFARELTERTEGAVVIGLDRSSPMLDEARSQSDGQAFINADAFDMPFRSGSIDVIVTVRFIRHFEYAHRRILYSELRRVLSEKGVMVLDVLNRDYHDALLQDRPIYDEVYSREQFTDEMRVNGFTVESFVGIPAQVRGLQRALALWSIGSGARLKLERWVNRLIGRYRLFTAHSPVWIAKCKRNS